MSRNELVTSYQRGRIGRRSFIKGMVALGMSATVATSMADKLRAAPAPKAALIGQSDVYDDIYDPGDVGTVTTLPATGIGGESSQTNWAAPLAVIGGAAAVVATRLRRPKTNETGE